MRLKLDMNKAYDRIEWDFVQAGFACDWVQLVMECISLVRFLVLLYGRSGTSFKPSRGIRQGDPISPYFFILVSDVLSSMLNKAVEKGLVQCMKFSGDGPILSHFIFAHDSILFLKATEKNCTTADCILRAYCHARVKW
ncbi:RNA-binding protein [Prunus dulcis]|uniref:RNA-binding protein n=1 Tax=Prunus dulcis TaxID=3755 RepID=A0A5H2Y783_PRUDU|nr:RNA-binding protein [Prunus dulcis]